MYIPAPHTEIDSLHSQGGVFVVEVDLYMESIYTNVVKISMGLFDNNKKLCLPICNAINIARYSMQEPTSKQPIPFSRT